MLKVREKALEKQIIAFLWSRRVLCTKIDSTGIYDAKKGVFRRQHGSYKRMGVSDIYALYRGVSIWIEVKSEKGRLSENQKEWLKEVEENGGKAVVARSVEDVEQALNQIDHVLLAAQAR